jgi:hypothetical protein
MSDERERKDQLNLRLTDSTKARLKKYREQLQKKQPGMEFSDQDVIRMFIERGLAAGVR